MKTSELTEYPWLMGNLWIFPMLDDSFRCTLQAYVGPTIIPDLSNKAVSMATTRYCYGVCAEPRGGYQLASRGDGVACVWDARVLQRPLLTLQHPRPLAQLQWCPTRWHVLDTRKTFLLLIFGRKLKCWACSIWIAQTTICLSTSLITVNL